MRNAFYILLTVVVAGAAVGAWTAWYVFSGRYTVAANEDHLPGVYTALDTVYRASVSRHADEEGLEVPDMPQARTDKGALVYAEKCSRCHAVPGDDRVAWVKGLMPVPPHLPRDGSTFDTTEIYWLVENGIRMSAMSSWEHVLSEADMWNVSAVVDMMPGLSTAEYQQMVARAAAAQTAETASASPSDTADGGADDGQPEEAASADKASTEAGSAAASDGEAGQDGAADR